MSDSSEQGRISCHMKRSFNLVYIVVYMLHSSVSQQREPQWLKYTYIYIYISQRKSASKWTKAAILTEHTNSVIVIVMPYSKQTHFSPSSRQSQAACRGSRLPPAAAATTAACRPPTAMVRARWWLGYRNQRKWTNVQRVSATFPPQGDNESESRSRLNQTPSGFREASRTLRGGGTTPNADCVCEFNFQSLHGASPTWQSWAGCCRVWRFCRGRSQHQTS